MALQGSRPGSTSSGSRAVSTSALYTIGAASVRGRGGSGITAQLIYKAGDRDCRRDCQVCLEAAQQDGLPADKGAERDAEKEGAVVPSQYGRTLRREVVGETGLLSREEQLRYP